MPGYPGLLPLGVDRRPAPSAPGRRPGRRDDACPTAGLDASPDGRYLVSVLADGYKLDGTRFTIPLERQPGIVDVPAPAPAAADRDDQGPGLRRRTEANGQYDPGEDGLAGFAGKITDYLGQVNDRRVRQPAVHDVRLHGRERQRLQDPGEIDLSDPDYSRRVVHARRQVPVRRHQHGRRRQRDRHQPVQQPRPRSGPRPGRADDPEPRPEPLRAVPRAADRVELGPDHHPRRQPRLGRLGHGGRDRPRHRVRRRRRAVPGHDLRLRPRPDDLVLDPTRPPVRRPAGTGRSRASSTPSTSTCRRPAGSTCPATAAAG